MDHAQYRERSNFRLCENEKRLFDSINLSYIGYGLIDNVIIDNSPLGPSWTWQLHFILLAGYQYFQSISVIGIYDNLNF